MEKKKQRTLAIWALAIAICATTVAYAVLATTLTISGTVIKKGGSWDVHLENVQTLPSVGQGTFISGPTITGTTKEKLTFSANLFKPNDSVSFTFDIKNGGSVDAQLDGVNVKLGNVEQNFSNSESITNNDITYKLTYADGSLLQGFGQTILAGASKSLKLTLTYNNVNSIGPTDVTMDVVATFNFSQLR